MDIREIIARYEKGEKIKILADELEKDVSVIGKKISKYYEKKGIEDPIKKEKADRKKRVEKNIEIIYERLKAGEYQATIAEEYNVTTEVIREKVWAYCYHHNKPRIKRINSAKPKLTKQDIETIVKEHKTGEITQKELASKYDVSQSTIAKYIRMNKESEEKQSENQEISNQEKTENQERIVQKVIKLYEAKKSVTDIQELLKISKREIRVILTNYLEIKDNKVSKNWIELLQQLGYDIDLIRKVAEAKNIGIEETTKDEMERE